MEDLLVFIIEINDLLKHLSAQSDLDNKHYQIFREKFSALQEAVETSQASKVKEICEWNRYYAPRLVYEGQNNKELLRLVILLNENASTMINGLK